MYVVRAAAFKTLLSENWQERNPAENDRSPSQSVKLLAADGKLLR